MFYNDLPLLLLLSLAISNRSLRATRRADMADLTTVLQGLTAVLTGIQAQQAAQATAAAAVNVPPPVTVNLNPFASAAPFDLGSRAGSHAFDKAGAILDSTWDGTIDKFPPFLLSLRIRASEVNWGANAPQGILSYTINGQARNLLTDHHFVTAAVVEASRAARTNDCAIQNPRALYSCLKSSITGDLKATLFDQAGNLPIHEDGPTLFIKLTSFTMTATLQLSMLSFKQILEFDPASCEFNIASVNTKLNHLFILATTSQRQLDDLEKIQHTITAYSRIKQPEQWASWVRIQVDRFEEGTITNCQAFMNSAAIKYVKISSANSTFAGSSTSIQEDIVAMVSASVAKRKSPPAGSLKTASSKPSASTATAKQPPFLKHYKSSSAADAVNYKVGDTRDFDGQTYHFCDCPIHRDRLKWHPFPYTECRLRTKWLAEKGVLEKNPTAPPPVAHVSDSDAATEPTDLTSDATPSLDATAALAHAFSQVSDPTVQALIADALNAMQSM